MMKLNYPDMLQQIKLSIFLGDNSAIYQLSCGVACIIASFALIRWYSKMMNDPYGRLDMSAVIRYVFVLIMICNFYSLVLVPFDYMTTLVAKGVTASVDKDTGGLIGKMNEIYQSIEEYQSNESLEGQLSKYMSQYQTNASVDGLRYESSAIIESQIENAIESRERQSFSQRLWNWIKGLVSARIGASLDYFGNILSGFVSIIVKFVQYILMAVSGIYLIILGLVGPFVFALSLIPGFGNNISVWIARYIQISFWLPMTALIDFVNFRLKEAMVAAFWSAPIYSQLNYPGHMIIMEVVTLICLLAVPSLSSWVITSAGASDVNRALATTAQKAVVLAGKL